jgi:acetoacetyl-CoA synthetase
VQLQSGAVVGPDLYSRISSVLRRRLSPRHVPDRIVEVPAIPYNLTGKKLEVPVKRLLQGAKPADVFSTGAVRDPAVLKAFEQYAASTVTAQTQPG